MNRSEMEDFRGREHEEEMVSIRELYLTVKPYLLRALPFDK